MVARLLFVGSHVTGKQGIEGRCRLVFFVKRLDFLYLRLHGRIVNSQYHVARQSASWTRYG
jgi:hypothetical protein